MGFLFKGSSSTTTRADLITSFMATTAEFGRGVPIAYGTCRLSPQLINYQDFYAKEIKTKTKTGKHSSSTSISYEYYVYLELGLCEYCDGLGKIWVGDTKYSDLAAFNASNTREGAPLSFVKRGNNTPTAYMKEKHSDKAVGYPDLAYVYGYVFLGENSASPPSYSFEILGNLRPSGDGTDANVASVIKDMLTRIGLGSYIDNTSWTNYYNYCQAADWRISTPDGKFDKQAPTQSYIEELLLITDTMMYWSNGKFKLYPRDDRAHGSWKPNTTVVLDLDHDDLSRYNNGVVTVKRKDTAEIYNKISVSFTSRANEYEGETVVFQDPSDISVNGIRNLDVDATWYHTKSRAIHLAEMLARKAKNEACEYTFQLGWKYGFLEPGDLVRISDPSINLSKQVVLITQVVENENGLLTVTAIHRIPGNYSAAKYEVVEDYEYVELNITPPDTKAPIFIQPPANLLTSPTGVELWIAIPGGEDDKWGGCQVWASNEDAGYDFYVNHNRRAAIGKMSTALATDGDSMIVTFPEWYTPVICTNNEAAADRGATTMWIGGEVISYTTCQYSTDNKYLISGLRRGQYQTTVTDHAANDTVVMLDESLCSVYLNKSAIGQDIYFRFPSFNRLGRNTQALEDTKRYVVTINPYDLPNCTNLVGTSRYADCLGAGFYPRYDLIVTWDPPEGFDNYSCASVWWKCSTTSVTYAEDGFTVVETQESGFGAKWQCAGTGYNTITIPQCNLGASYKVAVCTQDTHGFTENPDNSSQIQVTIAARSTIPMSPTNVKVVFGEVVQVSWDPVTNADVRCYEVRDEDGNILARTNGDAAVISLTKRKGVINVVAISIFDKESVPTPYPYDFPKPPQPIKPVIYEGIGGLRIDMQAIPSNCRGINIYINERRFFVEANTYNYLCRTGNYDIYYCFVDYFGDGDYSAHVIFNYKAMIDSALLDEEIITEKNLSSTLKATLDKIKDQESINTSLRKLIDTNKANILSLQTDANGSTTALTATNNAITQLAVEQSTQQSKLAQLQVKANEIETKVMSVDANGQTNTSLITQTADSITSIVAELNKDPSISKYSSITQLKNAIGLCVVDTDLDGEEIASRINISPNTVKIEGKYVHITGDTVFDNDVEIRGHMAAGTISADNVVITGGGATFSKRGVTVDGPDGSTVALDSRGMIFSDKYGYEYSGMGRIAAGTGVTDGNSGVVHVTFKHKFVKPPLVMITPQIMPRVSSELWPMAKEVCDVFNVTTEGFDARCGVFLTEFPTQRYLIESADQVVSEHISVSDGLTGADRIVSWKNSINENGYYSADGWYKQSYYFGKWHGHSEMIPESVTQMMYQMKFKIKAPTIKSFSPIPERIENIVMGKPDTTYTGQSRVRFKCNVEYVVIGQIGTGTNAEREVLFTNTIPLEYNDYYYHNDYMRYTDPTDASRERFEDESFYGPTRKYKRILCDREEIAETHDYKINCSAPHVTTVYNDYNWQTGGKTMDVNCELDILGGDKLKKYSKNGGGITIYTRHVVVVEDMSTNHNPYEQINIGPDVASFKMTFDPGEIESVQIAKMVVTGETINGDYSCFTLSGNCGFNWIAIEDPHN